MGWSEWKNLGEPIKLSNVVCSRVSAEPTSNNYFKYYAYWDISKLYEDYQNITVDNIIFEIVNSAISGTEHNYEEMRKTYNPTTGILTVAGYANGGSSLSTIWYKSADRHSANIYIIP